MRNVNRPGLFVLKMASVMFLFVMGTVPVAHGLRTIEMSEEVQRETSEPEMRRVVLKLPLRQPALHWTFMSKEDYLAGKLVLRFVRGEETTEIVVFEDGKIREGWNLLVFLETPGAGEVYFGIESSKKYTTSSADMVEIELHVKSDLEGIGERRTGILPKGVYKSRGRYSKLDNEYEVSDKLNAMLSRGILLGLQKAFEFRAVLGDWDEQWKLNITGREGWIEAE